MNVASKTFGALARGIFILSLPLLLLSASIAIAINSRPLYEYGFERYGVSQTTDLSPAQLDSVTRQLIGYFNSSDEPIAIMVVRDGQEVPLFKQKEVSHLADVKKLIQLDYFVLLGTMVFAAGYAFVSWTRRRKELALSAITGSGLSLALLLGLGLMASLNFDQFFWQFHLIAFSNDFWQLDPATDYLIRLFPEPFWSDATLFVGLLTAIGALAVGVAGWLYLKSQRQSSPG